MLGTTDFYNFINAQIAANPSIQPMTDAAAATALNALTTTQAVDILAQDIFHALMISGEWAAVKAAVSSTTVAAAKAANVIVTIIENASITSLPVSTNAALKTAFVNHLNALVSAGVIAAATQTTIANLATQTLSLFDRVVTDQDVHTARNGPVVRSA